MVGVIKEIVGHAWVLDRTRAPNLDRTEPPNLDEWRLLLITEVKGRGGKLELSAEFLETIHQHRITLVAERGSNYYVGQFASIRRDILSFFDEVAGERRDVSVTYKGMKPTRTESHRTRVSPADGRELDEFGIPLSLKTEGIPGSKERAHYIGRDPTSQFFEHIKEIVQTAAREGAQYLADFLIVMNDSRVKTLRSSRWTRELVSSVIYDIRNEDKLQPKQSSRSRTIAEAVHQVDREKTARELKEVEDNIVELEAAWDAATSAVQRQKIHQQLDAGRRKRMKLFGVLWG
jgi:hypothetical protein